MLERFKVKITLLWVKVIRIRHYMMISRIFTFSFIAISAVTIGVTSASAQYDSVPAFNAGVWSIKKTALSQTRGLGHLQLPCVMSSTFDNGFIMRMSGGGNKIMAMAIDFRQNVFRQGRKYDASIVMGSGAKQNISATAFAENILIFNLRKISDFYGMLSSGQTMQLNVDGNIMNFNMGSMGQNITDMEQCYAPGSKPATTQMASVDGKKEPSVGSKWNENVTPLPVEQTRGGPVPSTNSNMRWTAKSGDDVRDTLQRWSRQAGVTLDWQADNNGSVAGDIAVNGTFEDAVQTLMAQNAAALGVDANLMSAGAPQTIVPAPRAMTIDTPPMSAGSAGFTAVPGSSLKAVLQSWSKKEGVDLVWQASEDFRVKQAVNQSGSYEAALQALLTPYQNDGYRPAAHLNNDPSTGIRTLMVDSTRVR